MPPFLEWGNKTMLRVQRTDNFGFVFLYPTCDISRKLSEENCQINLLVQEGSCPGSPSLATCLVVTVFAICIVLFFRQDIDF